MSALLLAGLAPAVLCAPLLAPAVDRVESRRLLTATLLAQAGVTTIMAAAASLPTTTARRTPPGCTPPSTPRA
ncbi:hypothetical protein [Nocardia farcinica]|uniref:hypothetical protein n=1 Tax=Nocardia farcinica TaxID=37329 RepID=UPI0012FF2BF2|nr:hypothetical protein [Nocardia farcinica]